MNKVEAMAKALEEYLSGAYCGELTACAGKMIEKLKENGFKLTYIDTEDEDETTYNLLEAQKERLQEKIKRGLL